MVTTKRGRPALPGERYPSGERREASDPRSENVFRRFTELEQTVGLDPRLTSQIGRLRYLKQFTDVQDAAADKVGQVYGRFERTHRVRRHSVSPSNEIGRGRSNFEYDDAVIRAAEADYAAVQDCIPAFPREARDVIEQLCVENCAIPSWHLDDVRRVLDKVARKFGLASGEEARVSIAAGGARKRARTTPQKNRQPSRQEKFETGAYAARTEDATPQPSRHHEPGSQAERDHAALVRRLEAAQRRREADDAGDGP